MGGGRGQVVDRGFRPASGARFVPMAVTAAARAFASFAPLAFLRRRGGARLEAGHDDLLDLELGQLLDLGEARLFLGCDQRGGFAFLAGAAGAADAMHVILGDARQFVVDDVRQVVDVEAAGRDIGGDQHARRAGLEGLERLGAVLLALVAMNRGSVDAFAFEPGGQPRRAELGTDEDQHLRHRRVLEHLLEQVALAVGGDRVHAVGDGFRHLVAARDLDQLRRLEHGVGELLDLVREGGGKQQALARRRQQLEDALDVGDETHVEHAVGFVEDEELDEVEAHGLLFDVVEQPAGGRDDDFAAFLEFGDLRAHVDAAVNADRAQREVLAVGLDRFLDLHRQFARRREDQGAHRMARRRGRAVGMARQLVQQRQGEARRLAGAGLGAAHDVASGEDDGNGLGLDRGGFGVAGIMHGPEDFGRQPEVGEFHG